MTTTRISALRQLQGWTQERLASESGVGIRTIQRIEAGSETSLETLSRIAEALRVPVRDLFIVSEDEKSLADDDIDGMRLRDHAQDYEANRADQQRHRDRTRGAWVWLYIGIGVIVTVVFLFAGVPFWLPITIAYWAGGLILLLSLTALLLEPWLDRRYPLSRTRR